MRWECPGNVIHNRKCWTSDLKSRDVAIGKYDWFLVLGEMIFYTICFAEYIFVLIGWLLRSWEQNKKKEEDYQCVFVISDFRSHLVTFKYVVNR